MHLSTAWCDFSCGWQSCWSHGAINQERKSNSHGNIIHSINSSINKTILKEYQINATTAAGTTTAATAKPPEAEKPIKLLLPLEVGGETTNLFLKNNSEKLNHSAIQKCIQHKGLATLKSNRKATSFHLQWYSNIAYFYWSKANFWNKI